MKFEYFTNFDELQTCLWLMTYLKNATSHLNETKLFGILVSKASKEKYFQVYKPITHADIKYFVNSLLYPLHC